MKNDDDCCGPKEKTTSCTFGDILPLLFCSSYVQIVKKAETKKAFLFSWNARKRYMRSENVKMPINFAVVLTVIFVDSIVCAAYIQTYTSSVLYRQHTVTVLRFVVSMSLNFTTLQCKVFFSLVLLARKHIRAEWTPIACENHAIDSTERDSENKNNV